MPRVEETLRSLGLFGDASSDMLQEDLNRMRMQLAKLVNDRVVGNVGGGRVRTEIGPNSIPIGPYRQDVDGTFSLQFNLWIPAYQLKIQSATIHITPGAIRSSVAVGTSPSGTLTAEATGELEQVVQTHQHKWADYVGEGTGGGTLRRYNTVSGASLPNNTFNQLFDVENEDAIDLYTGQETATASVSVPAVEHTHAIDPHEHALELEIAEGGDATGLHFWLDGIDRTSELGGPWDDPFDLEIADYLTNIRMEPVVGPHIVKITSVTVGSIEAVGDIYGIIKPPR